MRGLEKLQNRDNQTHFASHHMRGLENTIDNAHRISDASHHMRGLEIVKLVESVDQ